MTVQKVLYHGTTMLRLAMIKRDGLLRCNMPKTWKAQEFSGIETGYVYLASDTDAQSVTKQLSSSSDKRVRKII